MEKSIAKLELKIKELHSIRKRCANETYFPHVGMLGNLAMRDFLDWHIKDLEKILKTLKNNIL